MKTLLTGLNGTVAPALARALRAAGHHVVAWDRAVVPTDDPARVRDIIAEVAPDAFFHVATGSPDWAEWVARDCAELGVAFLFTSSVSVFGNGQVAPFTVDVTPEPDDDYGRYKLECEQRVRAAHPRAIVARLAWQIGGGRGGNHMVDYLYRTHEENGRIDASVNWTPACAFLDDTGRMLVELLASHPPGLYHLDGNPGLDFFRIASGLNRLEGDPWELRATDEPRFDNRMVDERLDFPSISRRFEAIPPGR